MALPTALLHDLGQLSAGVGVDDDGGLAVRLSAVVQAVRHAVPSYRGLDVTVYDGNQPVSLTAFGAAEHEVAIATSLRLPFAVLGGVPHGDSRLVLYAAAPGAFVDLAADLGHALRAPVGFAAPPGPAADGTAADGQGSIVVDADLPPRTSATGLTGLDRASLVNRAVGMLIGQGVTPDEARSTLGRQAAAAGVELHDQAARMLRR